MRVLSYSLYKLDPRKIRTAHAVPIRNRRNKPACVLSHATVFSTVRTKLMLSHMNCSILLICFPWIKAQYDYFKTMYDRWDKLAADVNQSISAHSTYYPSHSKDGEIKSAVY